MRVLTVPMRNGNSKLEREDIIGYHSSYRTYEEWKPYTREVVPALETVLTVPMRNGNSLPRFIVTKSLLVLTVPMRNGNHAFVCAKRFSSGGSYRTYEEWKHLLNSLTTTVIPVLTVPMRNGNFHVRHLCRGRLIRSYRTYEEWKR